MIYVNALAQAGPAQFHSGWDWHLFAPLGSAHSLIGQYQRFEAGTVRPASDELSQPPVHTSLWSMKLRFAFIPINPAFAAGATGPDFTIIAARGTGIERPAARWTDVLPATVGKSRVIT